MLVTLCIVVVDLGDTRNCLTAVVALHVSPVCTVASDQIELKTI